MNQSGFVKTLLIVITSIIAIILLLIVVFIGFIWIKNPLGVRDLIKSQVFNQGIEMDENYDHPLLDANQEKQLREVGVDPAKLPTEITDEQKDCAMKKISPERAQELLSGASPTTADILKLAPCL